MKNVFLLLLSLLSLEVFAHGYGDEHAALKHWSVTAENKTIDASFLMYKDGDVYLEDNIHQVVHFPLTAFCAEDQAFVQQRYAQIAQLNQQLKPEQHTATASAETKSDAWMWIFAVFAALLARLFFIVTERKKRQYLTTASLLVLMAFLYGFKTEIARKICGTDPAFINSAFEPFKPAVHTRWDDTYFYVESKGIPSHQMMTGITGWQQQVPIPQCYIGNNAWSIPLNPVIAATPVPVNPQHFIRGAVAIAANGVPIFNPFTNTGVDALLDGQLDIYGGHCGRGDDYHYHIAPLQLDAQTPDVLPIAFALDGFAVYGPLEPDGTPMSPLDANHGHYGANGVYHYHGTPTAPYMIGNMVGQVTEDNTMQIIPQAHANPIRPAATPLSGAVITDCQANGSNNGYTLSYTRNNQTYQVEYSWTPAGVYTFHFISPTGTTTQTYNGFVPCEVPVATNNPFEGESRIILYPNPATGGISLKTAWPMNPDDIQSVSIFSLNGDLMYQTNSWKNVDIHDLAKGVYLVKIQIPGRELTQKLMIQ